MATQVTPHSLRSDVFHYKSFRIDKSQSLGRGSYGAVYKAKCDQLPCAAKVLHPTIVDPSNHDPGAMKIMDRFCQECSFLERIKHPNIVQYLAMTVDLESRLPVLLMELIDENLTKMLEHSQQSLAYYIQVDICHDVALAIAYLHSNDIIHRDLSSNNVLIIAGRKAKVTDFGMSKLTDAAQIMTPLSICPGTLAYMPPEALREPPWYTKKMDCFSEGVIMIQMCTRLWPEPGPRTQLVPFPASPTGMTEVPVLEPERRKNHIELIDPEHALLPIAMSCIKYQEEERPSSEELCQRLAGLKESTQYKESVEQKQDEIQTKDNLIRSLRQELRKKDTGKEHIVHARNIELQESVREYQERISVLTKQLQEKLHIVEANDMVLQQCRHEMILRERQLRELNQQLEGQEQVTAEIQQTNHSLQRQVEQLQQQLSQHTRPENQQHPQTGRKMSLIWRDEGKAPLGMYRGAAVVDGGVAYFMHNDGRTCSYNSTSKQWSELPKYPYREGSLAVINGQLTAIGGQDDAHNTNKVLTLRENWLRKSWSSIFPPMPTKRNGTIAVTWNEHLIVAGGTTELNDINTVEVMDTKHQRWSTVASLPHPYIHASATVCGNHLYMLGGDNDTGMTKSVLTCSLTELLQSSSSSPSVWYRVADAPSYYSTSAAVNGQLLAVGGCDEDFKATTAIHNYNPNTGFWEHISNMLTSTARFCCLVTVLATSEVMVVGGKISFGCYTDKVDIASVT